MKQQKRNIKAALLLFVFTLNSIVSFACSVSVDFNLNEGHHEHESSHVHEPAPSHHSHEDTASHSHEHSSAGKHNHDEKESSDDCCSDEVVKFVELDKSVNHASQPSLSLPYAVISAFYTFLIPGFISETAALTPKPPFDRSWDLTHHSDLRIVIQSFQI